MKKIIIDNKEIQYLIVNERGNVLESGEEESLETFKGSKVILETVEVGKPLSLTFNGKKIVELNYKTVEIWAL